MAAQSGTGTKLAVAAALAVILGFLVVRPAQTVQFFNGALGWLGDSGQALLIFIRGIF